MTVLDIHKLIVFCVIVVKVLCGVSHVHEGLEFYAKQNCFRPCSQGGCKFENCDGAQCPGGACLFVGCSKASCSGGACVFERCRQASCEGGGLVLYEVFIIVLRFKPLSTFAADVIS